MLCISEISPKADRVYFLINKEMMKKEMGGDNER